MPILNDTLRKILILAPKGNSRLPGPNLGVSEVLQDDARSGGYERWELIRSLMCVKQVPRPLRYFPCLGSIILKLHQGFPQSEAAPWSTSEILPSLALPRAVFSVRSLPPFGGGVIRRH